MEPELRSVAFYEFILRNGDTVVQYLFKPASLLIIPTGPSAVSNAEWEKRLRAAVDGMFVGVPLGEPMVSIIGAPFAGNQYAGEYLDFLQVSWQVCFL
jgi:hypothetical protein